MYERSDEEAILMLIDLAKTDNKALKLLVSLENSEEYGEADMLINKVHNFIKETHSLKN